MNMMGVRRSRLSVTQLVPRISFANIPYGPFRGVIVDNHSAAPEN